MAVPQCSLFIMHVENLFVMLLHTVFDILSCSCSVVYLLMMVAEPVQHNTTQTALFSPQYFSTYFQSISLCLSVCLHTCMPVCSLINTLWQLCLKSPNKHIWCQRGGSLENRLCWINGEICNNNITTNWDIQMCLTVQDIQCGYYRAP